MILLTVSIVDTPMVDPANAIEVEQVQDGFWRVVTRFGFMETPNVPNALARARQFGLQLGRGRHDVLSRTPHALRARARPSGDGGWRDKLFVFLSRNARQATNFFQIPPDRVVEIGIQLAL